MAGLDSESNDVIILIEQYLREEGLLKTLSVLQDESQVRLDIVDSIDTIVLGIKEGKWAEVLKIVKSQIPDEKLIDLYEQIVIETIDLGETKAAQYMIHNLLKTICPERCIDIQKLLDPASQQKPFKDSSEKRKRRAKIAHDLKTGLRVAPPQRLLTLIGDALRWQRHENLLPSDTIIDIFTNKPHLVELEVENHPNFMQKHIMKPVKDVGDEGLIIVCCAEFSPDGHYLAVAYSTGVVEMRNAANGRLANDLGYQRNNDFIVTPSRKAAISLAFDDEFEDLLAIGDRDGNVSIWKISTGQLYQVFESLHSKSVTCILFSRVSKSILTAGQDRNVWFHRIADKTLIHRYRDKHVVKSLAWSRNEHHMITCGDHYFVVWDTMLCNQLRVIKRESRLHSVFLYPNIKEDLFIVCQSRCIEFINLSGVIRVAIGEKMLLDQAEDKKHLSADKKTSEGKEEEPQDESKRPVFYAACISPKANWTYMVDSRHIYCFHYKSKQMKKRLLALEDPHNDLIGVKHHPKRNLIVTYDSCGNLKLWAP